MGAQGFKNESLFLAVVPFTGMENTERREESLALRFEKLQYLMARKRG